MTTHATLIDTPRPSPANQNPWYCLATLHGEWDDQSPNNEANIARNRETWNRWFASNEVNASRLSRNIEIAKASGVNIEPVSPLNAKEKEEIENLLIAKLNNYGSKAKIPDPTAPIDFSYVKFDKPISLKGFYFLSPCRFIGAIFSDIFLFTDTRCLDETIFTNANFAKPINFKLAYFLGYCNFSFSAIKSNSIFIQTRFHGGVSYENSRFYGKSDFTKCEIKGYALFSFTKFYEAKFDQSQFQAIPSFEFSKFDNGATFCDATFYFSVDFSNAGFNGEVTFTPRNRDHLTFRGAAIFRNANFNISFFQNTTFASDADFTEALFLGDATFDGAKFQRKAKYNGAIFYKLVNYINTEFRNLTYFTTTRFNECVPDFRGATLHSGTDWTDVRWPSAPQTPDLAIQQIGAYQRIKKEMIDNNNYVGERHIFRKELRAYREFYPRLSYDRLVDYLYDLLSGYGESILYPSVWLLVIISLGGLLLGGVDNVTEAPITMYHALEFSFGNVFSILPVNKFSKLEKLSDLGRLIYMAEALSGAILLFLLGLALRNRFRMK